MILTLKTNAWEIQIFIHWTSQRTNAKLSSFLALIKYHVSERKYKSTKYNSLSASLAITIYK